MCVSAATAQTVIVKGATAGTPIEFVVNGVSAGTATADAEGIAKIAAPQSGTTASSSRTQPQPQTRMNLYVDRCGNQRRVLLTDAVAGAPPSGGCVRDTVPWRFMVGRISTFVIDISANAPSVRLAQGEAPEAWLLKDVPGEEEAKWGPTPSGLMVFGGGGLGFLSGLKDVACGNVGCDNHSGSGLLGFGVQYWVAPMIGAEAQYVDPGSAKVEAGAAAVSAGYTFQSSLKSRYLALSGLVGAPLGRIRVYGRAGMNRHGATLFTTQVNEASTTGGEANPARTQQFEIRTEAWSPVFGGGVEGWLSQRLAIYGDVTRAWLGGDAVDAPEGRIDAAGWFLQAGVRFRLAGLGTASR